MVVRVETPHLDSVDQTKHDIGGVFDIAQQRYMPQNLFDTHTFSLATGLFLQPRGVAARGVFFVVV
jgi:hypothetical protein